MCIRDRADKAGRTTLVWRNKPQQADACVATLVQRESVAAVAMSATRVVGAAGKVVVVYEAETNELLEELEGPSAVTSVAITEDEDSKGWITAGYENGTINVWDAGAAVSAFSNYHALASDALPPSFAGTLELKASKENAHSRAIASVAFSPDGKTIVSGSLDKTIKVWDAGEPLSTIPTAMRLPLTPTRPHLQVLSS